MEPNVAPEFASIVGKVIFILILLGVSFIAFLVGVLKKSRPWLITFVVTAVAGVAAIVITAPAIYKQALAALEAQKKIQVEVSSSDGLAKVMLPGNWTANANLNEHATLAYSNANDQEYFLIIPEVRKDLAKGVGLDKYASMITTSMKGALKDSKLGAAESLKVGELPARRFRLEGEVQDARIVYSITLIETPDYFFQVLGWTLPSTETKAFATFDQVLKTFRFVSPAANNK